MNYTIMTARIASDPVRRETPSGIAVCNFRIAVNRPNTTKENRVSDFFDCVAWRHNADFVEKFFHKGDGITLAGNFQNKEWTDKEGNKRNGCEFQVNDIEFPLTRRTNGTADAKPETEKPAGYVEADNEPLPF